MNARKRRLRNSLLIVASAWLLEAACPVHAPAQLAQLTELPELPDRGILVIDASRLPSRQPLVYRVSAECGIIVGRAKVSTTIQGRGSILAGDGDEIVLGLTGDAPVVELSGEDIESWAERRRADGGRELVLKLKPALPETDGEESWHPQQTRLRNFQFQARADARVGSLPARLAPTLPAPGLAAGWSSRIQVESGDGVAWELMESNGLTPAAESAPGRAVFVAGGEAGLVLQVVDFGGIEPIAELRTVSLKGVVADDGRSVDFTFTGSAVVREDGAVVPLLGGQAAILPPEGLQAWVPVWLPQPPEALAEQPAGSTPVPRRAHSGLFFERRGTYPVTFRFVANVAEDAGWQSLNFALFTEPPVEVSVALSGRGVEFRDRVGVEPVAVREGVLRFFLPAGGGCSAAWREVREGSDRALFVEAKARLDILVEPGIVRQTTDFAFDVLQGEVSGAMDFRVEGDGEVTSVEGELVGSWELILGDAGGRTLRVTLLRPLEGKSGLRITSQAAVSAAQTTRGEGTPDADRGAVHTMRITPLLETLRMSGLVRVRADGAVEYAVTSSDGMIQLSPAEWATGSQGVTSSKEQQTNVFRFPLPDYALSLAITRIIPEVSVKQTLVYSLNESERRIDAEIELDIRKVTIREWEVAVPEGYALAGAEGADLADAAPARLTGGGDAVRLVFREPVLGRSRVMLSLERSEPGRRGAWHLPALEHPGAASVRGFVGVVTAPSFRLEEAASEGLGEAPISLFPIRAQGLRAAYRIREVGWSLTLEVSQVERSVAADLFHLYSLKEDGVLASILLNYFIVGAPVSEWRIGIPETAANLAVEGQGVRSWHVEGGEAIVSMDRPASGAVTLLVTFEVAAQGGKAKLQPGAVVPLDVQSEQGFIQIASPLQARHEVATISGGVTVIDPAELPAELRLLTSAPSVAVFEYAQRPFALEVEVDWFRQADPLERVADLASIESKVSRDGQVMTTARYFVKSGAPGMVRARLPRGASLWEAAVDGRVVTARSEDNATLVPVPATGDDACEMTLRYGVERGGLAQRVRLSAPVLDVPVLATLWTADAESGRVLSASRTGLLHAGKSLPVSGFEWLAGRLGLALCLAAVSMLAIWLANRSASGSRWRLVPVWAAFLLALGALGVAALAAMASSGRESQSLDLSASVAPGGAPLEVSVWNLPAWVAGASFFGFLLVVAGMVVLSGRLMGWFGGWRVVAAAGWVLISV